MTRKDYTEYQEAVAAFFANEGISNLSATDAESSFSWRQCECCGSTLGGDRYECTGYHSTSGDVFEYEVCSDCVYYAEYGQLDDMTMMDMGN